MSIFCISCDKDLLGQYPGRNLIFFRQILEPLECVVCKEGPDDFGFLSGHHIFPKKPFGKLKMFDGIHVRRLSWITTPIHIDCHRSFHRQLNKCLGKGDCGSCRYVGACPVSAVRQTCDFCDCADICPYPRATEKMLNYMIERRVELAASA